MEPRIDFLANEVGARISKRIYNVSLAIDDSPLPKATLELVSMRASQINGCGWCVDIHTKEAAAAGETAVRLHLVACPTRRGPRCASTTTTTRSPRWSPWWP